MAKGSDKKTNKGLYRSELEHDSCGVGFIVDIQGRGSHKIVSDALEILVRMDHRGASGAEENTGDGAGILTQIPHDFFLKECERLHMPLPVPGDYAIGMVFLPTDERDRAFCEELLAKTIGDEGQILLGWREVPTDNSSLGETAKNSQPLIKQVFIGKGEGITDNAYFERKLFVIRRWAKEQITRHDPKLAEQFYFASISSRTLVYKGMLTTHQLGEFYPDLADINFKSALALVHSRFSTNTFPNWSRSQPLRYLAHNGEINTMRGNINWMHARENILKSNLFGDDLPKFLHVLDNEASDSGSFDNVLETLTLAGKSLPHVMMMMIPEPLSDMNPMSEQRRAFYQYHSCLIEFSASAKSQ